MDKEIILYSTGCPQCHVLETKLNNKGIKYNVITDIAVMLNKGLVTVPVLEVDGELLKFAAAVNFINHYGE